MKRLLGLSLSAALVLEGPGSSGHVLFAQVLTGRGSGPGVPAGVAMTLGPDGPPALGNPASASSAMGLEGLEIPDPSGNPAGTLAGLALAEEGLAQVPARERPRSVERTGRAAEPAARGASGTAAGLRPEGPASPLRGAPATFEALDSFLRDQSPTPQERSEGFWRRVLGEGRAPALLAVPESPPLDDPSPASPGVSPRGVTALGQAGLAKISMSIGALAHHAAAVHGASSFQPLGLALEGLALAGLVVSAGYLLSGLHVAIAGYRQASAASAAGGPGVLGLLKKALLEPVSAASLPAFVERHLVLDGQARSGRKAGWLRAGLAQIPGTPALLWGQAAQGGRAVLRLAGTGKDMISGDPEVAPFVQPRRKAMRLVAGLLVADAALNVVNGHLIGRFLDAAQGASQNPALRETMLYVSGALLALLLVYVVVERTHAIIKARLSMEVIRDLRVSLFKRLLAMPLAWLIQEKSAEIASRMKDDVSYLEEKNVAIPISVPYHLLQLALSVGAMAWTHWGLTLVALAFLPILGIVNGIFGHKQQVLADAYQDRKAELVGQAQEALEHAYAVKSYANEDYEVERLAGKADEARQLGFEQGRVGANWHALASSLTDFFTRYAIAVLGGWVLAASMGLTIGQITSMTLFAGYVKYSLDGLSGAYQNYRQYKGATQKVLSYLRAEPALRDAPDAVEMPPIQGEVRFEGVSFAYEKEGRRVPILQGLDLTARPGEMVAIVGETGSGKSTVLRLIQRLWDPDAGRILVDGLDIRTVKAASLNRQVALVPQDTALFSMTIRENMVYGNPGATNAELGSAIRDAKAGFVFDKDRFPEGLQTKVGERGARLSGGERQRVAIVRALLRKPRILLLDEATSALDNESEKVVQAALEELIQGEDGLTRPTTFVIAHRLTTVQRADRIVVLDQGRIVEQGTHDSLMALQGRYHRLYTSALAPSAPRADP